MLGVLLFLVERFDFETPPKMTLLHGTRKQARSVGWRNAPFFLPFCLVFYVTVCCFSYKSKAQYFCISPGLCILFTIALTFLCTSPTSPADIHLMIYFRFMEMQENARCC
jgi:hypothetical protein